MRFYSWIRSQLSCSKKIPISPKDAVFFPKNVYHSIKNPNNTPLEALWIISPAGWVFDLNPKLKKEAMKKQ